MALKLQGLAAKISKLKHDAEFEAEKLDSKIEGVAAKLPGVFSGAHNAVDGLAQQVDDVDAILTAVQAVTNGGSPLDDHTTALPPVGPAVSYP